MNEKIEAIYKEIANKELSLGCTVRWYKRYGKIACNPDYVDDCEEWLFICNDYGIQWIVKGTGLDFEIIWHDVMIWDVLDWWDWYMSSMIEEIFILWKNKRLPIEKQSEQCIDYVLYNLIETWKK